MAGDSASGSIEGLLLEHLAETPKAMGALAVSFVSGHLWYFIVTTFIRSKTKGNPVLKEIVGKTGLGLLWFSLILILCYWWKHGKFDFAYQGMLEITIPVLVFGLAGQLVIFCLFVIFGDRR